MSARTLRNLALALGFALLGLICCTRADAQSQVYRPSPEPPAYSVSIEDEDGNPLPLFVEHGRRFVLGRTGQRYNIRVRNPSSRRVEAVLSVDGRDVVSGRVADYVSERGYVVPAYGSVLIEGFRRDLSRVASFRFSSPEASYSARRGRPQYLGVVGAAFFPERAPRQMPLSVRPRLPVPTRSAPAAESEFTRPELAPASPKSGAPSATDDALANGAASTPDSVVEPRDSDVARAGPPNVSRNRLGTEFGEPYESRVNSVSFERAQASHPAQVLTLRYDDAAGLTARGIDVSAYVGTDVGFDQEPTAFPGSRFAEPPP